MDLSLAIAQGFHNAPRLYGDSTVRTTPRISGIQSGLKAAGLEFTYGVYDGFTGLVMQPYNGARDKGVVGFVQGVGKGFGGFVLKDLAAIVGPFGYTLKGVHKELIKGRQPTAFIRKARMIQGGKDARALDGMAKERESAKIDAAWGIIKEIEKEDEAQKEEGLKGRVAVMKEKQKQGKHGAYENVRHAKKALKRKQADRKERESVAISRNSGEERRGSKVFGFGKRGSLQNSGNGVAKGERKGSNGIGNGSVVKGADRDVKGETLDLGPTKPQINGDTKHTTNGGIFEPVSNGHA